MARTPSSEGIPRSTPGDVGHPPAVCSACRTNCENEMRCPFSSPKNMRIAQVHARHVGDIGVVLARRHRAPGRLPVEISFDQALDELEHAVAAFAALVHLRHASGTGYNAALRT